MNSSAEGESDEDVMLAAYRLVCSLGMASALRKPDRVASMIEVYSKASRQMQAAYVDHGSWMRRFHPRLGRQVTSGYLAQCERFVKDARWSDIGGYWGRLRANPALLDDSELVLGLDNARARLIEHYVTRWKRARAEGSDAAAIEWLTMAADFDEEVRSLDVTSVSRVRGFHQDVMQRLRSADDAR